MAQCLERMDDHHAANLTEAILVLAGAVKGRNDVEFFKSLSNIATKTDLKEMETRIMSAISDYAAKQSAFNDRQDAAITDLQGDVQNLNDQITALQNSPGSITPEDQALLDGLTARGESIATKLEALDNLTPPKAPTA